MYSVELLCPKNYKRKAIATVQSSLSVRACSEVLVNRESEALSASAANSSLEPPTQPVPAHQIYRSERESYTTMNYLPIDNDNFIIKRLTVK